MQTRFCLAGLVAVIACTAQARDPGSAQVSMDTAALSAEVRVRAEGFAAAVLAGNVDSVLSFVTSDIVLLEPGIDVKGREAFRTLLVDLWKVSTITSFAMTPESHAFGPGVVTEFGRYRESFKDSTGVEQTCDCVYSVIWRKEADGMWRQGRIHAGQPIKP
jgi:ketosteroid isomerase-like protein